MFALSMRRQFLIGFFLMSALMGMALYFQYIEGLLPCPLCIFQRFTVIGLGVIFLLGAIHNPKNIGRKIYAALLSLTALAGIVIAGRHVWLQHLPKDQAPACGPGLDFWLQKLPLTDVILKVFSGSGECAEVSWTFLSLSIPEWTLGFFLMLFSYSLFVLIKSSK